MKIGFLTPEYPHPKTGSSGGIGTSIKNLACAIFEKGHAVSVFVYGQKADEEFIVDGVRIIRIKNARFKGISWLLTRKKIQKIINESFVKHQIDIIEVPDWTGISSFMNLRCPIVMRLNGSDTYFCDMDNRVVKPWNKLFEKIGFKKATGIIAVSQFVGERTNRLFEHNRAFTKIPNGVNLGMFPLSSSNIIREANTIIYFGTLVRKKGLLDIPLIFNKLNRKIPSALLVLIGGDSADVLSGNKSTWEMMKTLFTSEALTRVNYVGKIPYDEIKANVEQATVCIFPSYAEACPVSWIEAMAMGKAIVASNIGWAPEIIEDGKEGYLVSPQDHELYAEKIAELITDKNLNHSFGAAAAERVKKEFSNEIVADQTLNFYSSVLNKFK